MGRECLRTRVITTISKKNQEMIGIVLKKSVTLSFKIPEIREIVNEDYKISDSGSNMLARIRDYDLLTRGKSFSELDKKVQSLSLERMMRLFGADIYDLIEATLETIIEDLLKIQFENIDYKKQMIVVNTINEAVKSIQDKTSEIALIFSSK